MRIKSKIEPHPKQRQKNMASSQYSGNTQHNFISINELSSIQDGEKETRTISNIRKKHLMQNLINRLKFLIAPHLSPPNMKENWSQEHKTVQKEDYEGTLREVLLSQIGYKYSFWHIIKMISAICIVLIFWASSTELVFLKNFQTQEDQNLFSLYFKAPLCMFIILKILIKQLLIIRQKTNIQKSQTKQQNEQRNIQQIQLQQQQQQQQKNYEQICHNLKDISKSIIYISTCVIYLLIHALGSHPLRDILQVVVVAVFFCKVCNMKENIEQIYSYVEAKDYKNQFRIVVLFFLVLGVCHFIALVLYQKNWMNAVQKQAVKQNTWFSHYTCSIYFAITTMATVGYGDFSPNQTGQMFLVSLIQLFGSALFGYMINVVGLTVAQINKKNQEFDNHMSTINKLQNHYQISRQLCQKFRHDIIKNESIKKQTPLSENQQTQFFKMIQNSLKQQFILETNIKVIKKSIFFLTHFTVNFQNQIALKLIRKIYKKNEKVPLVEFDGQNTQRCMLIINSGSVDIQLANQSSNIEMRKFIKNISPQEGKPTLNVFGYSALILNKDIDLQATTKDTSVIYLLKRKDVLECMDKNMLDFQGIAQLRQKMLNYKNVNHIQGQTMLDIQKHYVPNVYFVNKKKKTVCQSRCSQYKRNNRKCKIKLITLKNYQFRTMMCIDLEEQQQEQKQKIVREKITKTKTKIGNQSNMQQAETSLKFIQDIQLIQNYQAFVAKMDQVKDYQNFMKKSNISRLIPKYHEYLRTLRKQKKNKEMQKNQIDNANREQNNRAITYTEGMINHVQIQKMHE